MDGVLGGGRRSRQTPQTQCLGARLRHEHGILLRATARASRLAYQFISRHRVKQVTARLNPPGGCDTIDRLRAIQPGRESMKKSDTEKPSALSRRSLLKSASGAVLGAAAASLTGARAQVTGLTPEGGGPPFRLAMCALDFLDRKTYAHNMEVVAYLPGSTISGGDT